MKWDSKIQADEACSYGTTGQHSFGLVCYRALLTAMLTNPRDIDIDLLLLLKDEVFVHRDCTYFALLVVREVIEDIKSTHNKNAMESAQHNKNVLDVMRVVPSPNWGEGEGGDVDNASTFLVPLPHESATSTSTHTSNAQRSSKRVLDDEESSDEEAKADTQKTSKKRKQHGLHTQTNAKKLRAHIAIVQKLRSAEYYKQEYQTTWLATLSLQFTPAQHKLILKHLPLYVTPHLPQPLLLADYLTASFQLGGVSAILALESLLQLIIKHNLDYPQFFLSLYKLCTVSIFNAPYKNRFLKLLHMSLRSVNMPAYQVAAFIKRLAGVALHVSAPCITFCMLQIQWLFKHHQQCLTLLHNDKDLVDSFNVLEESDLEKSHALSSSLWEIEALESHYLYKIAKLAASFRVVSSTAVKTVPTVIDDSVTGITYATLIDEDMEVKKKMNVGRGFMKPQRVVEEGSVLSKLIA
ncbi:hypothetical protein EON64_09050 [archaeon]|nr:MAG: hypothetical protein EON64_09050 [archaeon]